MQAEILRVARSYNNLDVDIDEGLPYISVENRQGETVFFDQGDGAREMLDEAEKASDKFSVDMEDWILFYLDSAGALSGRCGGLSGAHLRQVRHVPEPRFRYVIPVRAIVYKQDIYGNTYHEVIIFDNQMNRLWESGRTYGYGSAYEDTAHEGALKVFKFPRKYMTAAWVPEKTDANGVTVRGYLDKHRLFRAMKDDHYLRLEFEVIHSTSVRKVR
jgi:hypothetical protein